MVLYHVDPNIIRGVKVIVAHPGSIVLDLLVLYSYAVTTQKAFNHFIDAVVDRERTKTHPLGVKFITPLLEEMKNVKESMTGMVVVVIPVSLLGTISDH